MKKIVIFPIVFVAICFFLSPGYRLCAAPAQNDPGRDVLNLLKTKVDAVLSVLNNEKLSVDEKKKKIEILVDPLFDYKLIAKLTLGRKYWGMLDSAQKKKFVNLFVCRMKQSYFDKVALYSGDAGAKIVYGTPNVSGRKVSVPMEVTAKETTVSMEYKFYKDGKVWRIYDVSINGVSIVASYRSQFAQVMENGGVKKLLSDLELPPPAAGGAKPGGKDAGVFPCKEIRDVE